MEPALKVEPSPPAAAPGRPPLRALPSPDAERLASLGLVTAGVAHELNGPLSYVIGNLGLVAAALAEASASGRPLAAAEVQRLLPAVRDALDGAERMRAIAGDLRQLSRREDEPLEPVSLERSLERALAMAHRELAGRAVVERRLAGLPAVAAREGRLVQVLLNLLVNAAHATPPGQPERQVVRVVGEVRADGWVVVEVRDAGCGIPAERLGRIFEPFFTTKRAGVGSGLGLYLCRAIVAGFGGTIEAESEVGRGTTLRLALPAWEG